MRFTIKSWMIVFLVVLGIVAVAVSGSYSFLAQMSIAAVLAALLDAVIGFSRTRKFELPSSGIISGLFVGLILPASLVMTAAAVILAIASKHVIKFHKRHIFNPAAFGIVFSSLIFGFVPIWWGSATLLVIPLGLFIIYKQRKWLLALSFIIAYYIILAAINFSDIGAVSFIDTTLLFFAFFMLIEPMTSTYAKKAMVSQGILVAVLAIIFSFFASGIDIFLAPLLISNIFVEAMNKRFR
ncbi:hypothetical protein HY501_02595 [Candidatus Woesearchaeota archaeon]|nr:hypothetical protein [Candidatus Woesearchaeota archaeon]